LGIDDAGQRLAKLAVASMKRGNELADHGGLSRCLRAHSDDTKGRLSAALHERLNHAFLYDRDRVFDFFGLHALRATISTE
jgi:hypothetical protein